MMPMDGPGLFLILRKSMRNLQSQSHQFVLPLSCVWKTLPCLPHRLLEIQAPGLRVNPKQRLSPPTWILILSCPRQTLRVSHHLFLVSRSDSVGRIVSVKSHWKMLKVSLERKRVGLLYPISETLQYGGGKGCYIQIPHSIGHIRNVALRWQSGKVTKEPEFLGASCSFVTVNLRPPEHC